MKTIHRLSIPLQFPNGIAPGEGSDYNVLRVARNGNNEPVLRGTAIVGALRHAWRKQKGSKLADETYFFGYANDERGPDSNKSKEDVDASDGKLCQKDDRTESRLTVNDAVLQFGKQVTRVTTHHRRNRHTGSVASGALYSIESCPKDTVANVTLWLDDERGVGEDFLRSILAILRSDQTLGGKSARGFGSVTIDPDQVKHRKYELPHEYGAYLDEHRQWRSAPNKLMDGEVIKSSKHETAGELVVKVSLAVPRGQDMLVGDGQGLDHEIEPQSIVAADGTKYWCLPGSSIRGMLRSWMTRLAAKDEAAGDVGWDKELKVKDTAQHYGERLDEGDAPSAYYSLEERQPEATCPVYQLFGSPSQRGRIHVTNGYARCSQQDEIEKSDELQERMHVAVDRVTGGAAESMLFENTVLTSTLAGQFLISIRIKDCKPYEAKWLARTLMALDVGVLRVGSSKSSGRLEIAKLEIASGAEFATEFEKLEGKMDGQ